MLMFSSLSKGLTFFDRNRRIEKLSYYAFGQGLFFDTLSHEPVHDLGLLVISVTRTPLRTFSTANRWIALVIVTCASASTSAAGGGLHSTNIKEADVLLFKIAGSGSGIVVCNLDAFFGHCLLFEFLAYLQKSLA